MDPAKTIHMTPMERMLSGDALLFDLGVERKECTDPESLKRSGRHARTILRSGPLRVTVVALAAGGEIPEHRAEGPITVQPLEGRIRFTVAGHAYDMGPGELLAVGPGVPHSVSSAEGAAFMLTGSHPA